jgi:WD40 repeat protein
MRRLYPWYVTLAVFALLPSGGFAQESSGELTYWQDIRPIFRKHCTACHSTRNLKEVDVSGGLALDTFDATKKGSKHPVLTPGKSEKSILYDLLVTTDVKKRMPLDSDPLSKEKIATIKKWIDSGAKEGTPPVETATLPSTKKVPTRKLDLIVPLTSTPPSGTVFGLKATGKMDLAMKIGPLAPVTAVAFSPDNKLLATGSYGQVVVWDVDAGKPVKLLTNVLGAINDIRFSPKGDILAVGGGQPSAKGDLRLYQVSDWKLLATLRGHDDVVFSLAFSPDGQQLASASFDHTVRLWNVQSHESLKSYGHHSDFVYAVAFSPSGKQLASASKDRTVQLFDVQTGKSVFTFSGMDQDVMAVAFSTDGKTVVSSGFEPGIYWWNAMTGEKIKTQGGHGVAVHELAFSKDGKRVLSAGADRTVRTWDGTAGTAVKVFPVGSIAYCAAISPNGKRIAAGSFDGLVRVWDEASGRHLVSLLAYAADTDQSEWLVLTPEGYATGSEKLTGLVRWRISSQEVPAMTAWAALRRPAMIAQALRGEAVAEPKFEKK